MFSSLGARIWPLSSLDPVRSHYAVIRGGPICTTNPFDIAVSFHEASFQASICAIRIEAWFLCSSSQESERHCKRG